MAGSENMDAEAHLKLIRNSHLKRRLRQISGALGIGLTALVVSNLMFGASLLTTAFLCLALVAVLVCYQLLRQDHLMPAAYLLMWSGTAVCMMLMWSNHGLRDTSLLAFPAILFFAAIIGVRRLFYILFVAQLTFLLLVGLSELNGWKAFPRESLSGDNIVDVVVLLGLVGFCIRLLSVDMAKVMDDLKVENTRSRLAEEDAQHRAHHDELTGLPNRVLARERFEGALAAISGDRGHVALLFIDLDYFKAFNDSLGHSVGDQLICEVGKRLSQGTRGVDTVCRYGGDEFIVLLSAVPDVGVARRCADELLERIGRPMELEGHALQVSASIGLVMAPDDGTDFEDLCSKADMAMYKAKETGRNTLKFFDEGLNLEAHERMQLIAGLQRAVREGEFQLLYQPQVDLDSGEVVGAEALLRWSRPGQGLILPDTFLAIAEETNLIIDIGDWVLREASRQCLAWHREGHTRLRVSVNVSTVQLMRGGFDQNVVEVLGKTGLAPQFLDLELVESVFIDTNPMLEGTLQTLREMGVGISIDDFGTGYSNLSYLSRFNAQTLKVDRTFVMRYLDAPEEIGPILTAIIQLGKGLGMTVVAEGVESAQMLAELKGLGCDLGQGFYWSEAIEPEAFLALVRDRANP